ncbi:MAG: MmcQ/YjbR family DNA-binding protein [Eubacteriales bacterium]|nr:MmcQ/YjbR family DNA-binding protein [Eubacteriales bacterium]
MADTSWLDAYLLHQIGAVKDYKEEWGWHRYMVGGKMFAATCCPGDVHAVEYANHPLLNLKCDPLESEFLRSQYTDILPGFYSDKRCWISVRMDGSVPRELIQKLCDGSYALIFAKLTKKLQREIQQRYNPLS